MADLTDSTSPPEVIDLRAPGPISPSAYGAHYYDRYQGGPYEFEGHWAEFFGGLADRIVKQFDPARVLDAGCAKGFLVHALRERGVEAFGIDNSEYAVQNALESVRPFVRLGSMAEPIEGRYDLVTCIESIEHVAPAEVRRAVDSLSSAADVILLSSTFDGEHYGDPTHTSMRAPEDWAALFAEHAFLPDPDIDVSWVTPWATVLTREAALTVPEVVRRFGRHLARARREVSELRRSGLEMARELDGLHSGATGGRGAQHGEIERLRRGEERAAASRTEAMRLRDLLIVSERALGQANGELALLRRQLHDYPDLVDRHNAVITSTTWRIAWKVFSPYRITRERLSRR